MHRLSGKIVIASLGLVIAGLGTIWAINWLRPNFTDRRPNLVDVPPLAPVSRSSRIVMPAAIALTALSEAMERVPRELSGKSEIPLGLSSSEIAWSVARGAFAVNGGTEGLTLSAALNGSLRASAQFTGPPGFPDPRGAFMAPPRDIPGLPPGLLRPPGGSIGRGQGQTQAPSQGESTSEQRADIRGHVVLTARPIILPQWRVQPNLVAKVTINEASANFFGMNFSLSDQVKPLLERSITEQVGVLQGRLSDDPLIEHAARQEWAKMCRSIALGAILGAPNLWLEVRPTRAFAAQPRIDQSVRRLLQEKVKLGLFDQPLHEVDRAVATIGRADFVAEGEAAQRAAIVRLTAADSGPAALPVSTDQAVYIENIGSLPAARMGRVVDDPADADLAVLRLNAPYEPRPGGFESFFHAGSLELPVAERDRILRVCEQVPTIIVLFLDRPAIVPEIARAAATFLVEFGARDDAVVDVLLGEAQARGRLPFDLPSSTKAVTESGSDVPYDTADPLFRFGDGIVDSTAAPHL